MKTQNHTTTALGSILGKLKTTNAPLRSQNRSERLATSCKPWVMLFVAALLVGGCGSAGKADPQEEAANAPHVGIVRVVRKNLSSNLQIASELLPFQEVNVYAKVSGYIQRLYVDWGTHVRKGQLLAVLEIPELQQQLELDEASVRRSEHDLTRTREDLNQAESKYVITDLTYNRLSNVLKTRPGLVAQEDVDVSSGKNLEAKAGVSGAKAAVAAAEQALMVAKAALEKDKAVYGYSRIAAPFDGVVTRIDAYGGSLLPAGTSSNGDQALCHLSQNDLLRLVIPVPERVVGDVHLGENVTVQVSNNNQKFQGKIVRFSEQIDTQTRTMHTEVDVKNLKYLLVPGMYATVLIPLHTVINALTVPTQAVQTSSGGHGSVLVVNSGFRIEKRDVVLGLQTATDAEILSGLQEKEMVVFGEQSQYKPGELVSPSVVTPSEME
jgi:RND family efflux transporter MFP subunit